MKMAILRRRRIGPRRWLALGGWLFYGIFAAVLTGQTSAVGSRDRVIETASFLLVAQDPETLLYARDLATRAEAVWEGRFGPILREVPRERVRLETAVDEERTVLSGRDGDGWVVALGRDTPRRELSLLLARAWWHRVQRNLGRRAEAPSWLVVWTAAQLEVSVNPLFRDILRLEGTADAGNPPSLERLLRSTNPSQVAWSEAWVLGETLGQGQSLETFLRANELSTWAATIGARDLRELRLRWQTAWIGFHLTPLGPHWDLATSAHQLERLTTLNVWFRGVETRLDLAELRRLMGSPSMPSLVDRRIAWIRRNLPRIHPVYHNALATLGEVYEAIGQGDSRAAEAARRRFLEAREAADLMAHELIELRERASGGN
jgi:hypothetical protein